MPAKCDRRAFLKGTGAAMLAGGLVPQSSGRGLPGESAGPANGEVYGSADPWIEVDRKAIDFNVRQLKKKVGGRAILAVLKCNAYGHGLIGVAKGLERSPVHGLVVGRLNEALALRTAGIKLPILNLGPFSDADAEAIVRQNIDQTIYTDAITARVDWARKFDTSAGVHVEIDTGLGRTGVPHGAALAYIRRVASLRHLRIEGTFQSFSEDPEFDRVQLQRFLAVTDAAKKEGLPVGLRHASASTAVFSYGAEFYLDAVRPGIAIYGHYPTKKEHEIQRMELRPALSWKTRASFVKTLQPGESLSYFRKFVAEGPERIVTAALGYSDGAPPDLAGGALALIRGKKFPFICDLSANHSYLRVTGDDSVVTGDEIVLVGRQAGEEATLWDLAQATRTSDYKILIGLNPALRRIYSD